MNIHNKPKNVAYIMYIVGFLDLFGVSLVIPLLSKHARDLGASPSLTGLVGSVYGALQLLSSPVIGSWSDISGRRYVLLWCLMLAASGYLLLGFSTTIPLLVIARIPPGLFKHSQEIARGYLADTLPSHEQPKAFGYLNAASSVGFIVGPLLGGHIATWYGGFTMAAAASAGIFILNLGLFKHGQSLSKVSVLEFTPPEERYAVLGRYNAVSNMGFILGPALGGLLADRHGGLALTSALTVCAFAVNFLIVWWFVPPRLTEDLTITHPETEEHVSHEADKEISGPTAQRDGVEPRKGEAGRPAGLHTHLSSVVQSFREVELSQLWDIFLIRFLCGLAALVYRNNFAMMLDYKYGVSTVAMGYLTSYSAVVGTISGFFVGKIAGLYRDQNRLFLHACVLQFGSILFMAVSPSLWILILCLTPLSVANQIARVCATSVTLERGGSRERGALLGLGASVVSVARMLSPALGGLAQEFHVSGPCLVGAVSAGLGVAFLILGPSNRQKAKVS